MGDVTVIGHADEDDAVSTNIICSRQTNKVMTVRITVVAVPDKGKIR